jgi:glycosyltransferase involved in cell wall biosynthesis
MLGALRLVTARRQATLVLVGDGPYRSVVERLLREYGLTGCVVLMGRRSDVPRLLRSADLFVMSSRTEGLPNAVLEAMAAGLGIVATDVPGCRDLVLDGRTGLLAPVRSAEAIARQLLILIEDPTKARQLGWEARNWVHTHANLAGLAGRWVRVYEDAYGLMAKSFRSI